MVFFHLRRPKLYDYTKYTTMANAILQNFVITLPNLIELIYYPQRVYVFFLLQPFDGVCEDMIFNVKFYTPSKSNSMP